MQRQANQARVDMIDLTDASKEAHAALEGSTPCHTRMCVGSPFACASAYTSYMYISVYEYVAGPKGQYSHGVSISILGICTRWFS